MEEAKTPVMKEGHSIKLSRGMKGVYGWEIKIAGEDENDILKRIESVDKELVKRYIELNTEGIPNG